jgi:hypothetical protein
MSAPYHYLHRKLEDALKSFLEQNTELNATVYTFMEAVGLGEAVVEPYVGIRCRSSSPTVPEVQLLLASGSRIIQAELKIRSHALNTTNDENPIKTVELFRDVHAQLVGNVVDCFYRSDIIEALNAIGAVVGGIEIEQIDQPEMEDNPEDRSGVTVVTFPIYCHPIQ